MNKEVSGIFKLNAADYTAGIRKLIEKHGGKRGYVEYDIVPAFKLDVMEILREADLAILSHQFEIAKVVLVGVSDAAEDIADCGDDSGGELIGIIDKCFDLWHHLCAEKDLPEGLRSELFEYFVSNFTGENLKGWNSWWDWMEMAVSMADSTKQQERLLEVLDNIGNDNRHEQDEIYYLRNIEKYKVEILFKMKTPEERGRFLYENAQNPDFRRKLLHLTWENEDYEEVFRLASEGVSHDAECAELVKEWRQWEFKACSRNNDKASMLKLSRYFFFNEIRSMWEIEYSKESMYSRMKSIVPDEEWSNYVETLIEETLSLKDDDRLLFIYVQEKMWNRYMEYLHKTLNAYRFKYVPREVWDLYRSELLPLYASHVRRFFKGISGRTLYCTGVEMLWDLIKQGGEHEVERIVEELKSSQSDNEVLMDELSKL